jgi:hypothetical protein
MKSTEECETAKIRYDKPTAIDLGPAASIVGASCVDGLDVDNGRCINVGNSAVDLCGLVGNSAGAECGSGSSPGADCNLGSGVAP